MLLFLMNTLFLINGLEDRLKIKKLRPLSKTNCSSSFLSLSLVYFFNTCMCLGEEGEKTETYFSSPNSLLMDHLLK